ncbi:MAG: hypothetical protein JW795_04995 [Chitinivibrionales bacterium]|nr:hypothetical protein [Chitinivibrionales bacterium]
MIKKTIFLAVRFSEGIEFWSTVQTKGIFFFSQKARTEFKVRLFLQRMAKSFHDAESSMLFNLRSCSGEITTVSSPRLRLLFNR